MFALIVSLHVRPGRREEFLDAIRTNAEASLRDEPGCLRFDVLEQQDAEDRFVLYEVYRDERAFSVEHRGSPHYARWHERAAELLAEGGQVNTFLTPVRYSPADEHPTGGDAVSPRW